MIGNAFEISSVKGREIIDSRGNPTVEAEVTLHCGAIGRASVPSGASTGEFEAHELRDQDENRFGGLGTQKAVQNIEGKIASNLIGIDASKQRLIDQAMIDIDGTPNKTALGANAILAVSVATARAAAAALQIPLFQYLGGSMAHVLPVPMMNILNGGKHASNNIDIQEFMIVPFGAHSFKEALEWCTTVYHTLGKFLYSSGLSTSVGDEGGFAPNLESDEQAIEIILEAIEKSGFKTTQIGIALDAATSEWYSANHYTLLKRQVQLKTDALIEHWQELAKKYPILSIEDGLSDKDWNGWTKLTEKIPIQLVGDDLFVTNSKRLERGIAEHAANAILVKINQIGTLKETFEAIELAKNSGYKTIISHRSGETEDTFIADLAVATGAGQIKAGAPARTDRAAKYNQLLRIEEYLGSSAVYAGKQQIAHLL